MPVSSGEEAEEEGETDSPPPSKKSDVRLNPKTLGPELKADA